MNISGAGYTLDTLDDVLTAFEISLREKFGSDFYIKAEGVLSNIIASVAFQELTLQEQVAFLIKQFDPETAEGQFQDALYERIGCYRIKAEKTVVERTIKGTEGIDIPVGAVTIRNKATLDEFVNRDAVTIGAGGEIVADFECVLFGEIEFPKVAELEVISIPLGVNTVITPDDPKVAMGRNRESDEDFKSRFRNAKSVNAKATRNALYSTLTPLVEDLKFLIVQDCKTNINLNKGELAVIAKHKVTDTIFGRVIFETIADGVDTVGTDTLTTKDDVGEDVDINWTNASPVEIEIKADITKKSGAFWGDVQNDIKKSIIDYINKRIYGLAQTVYANEFIIPMYQVEGVETADNIEVSVNGSGAWGTNITMLNTQYAIFNKEWILLNEI